jgi:hypothetical protein
MAGSGSSGEPGHREIEGAPEEVDRAALAGELAAEPAEDALGTDQGHPEAVHRHRIVTVVGDIVGERDRGGHLDRARHDRHPDPEASQHRGEAAVEGRHRHRLQGERLGLTEGGPDDQLVTDEVELDLDASVPIRHQGRGQPVAFT